MPIPFSETVAACPQIDSVPKTGRIIPPRRSAFGRWFRKTCSFRPLDMTASLDQAAEEVISSPESSLAMIFGALAGDTIPGLVEGCHSMPL